MAQPILHNGIRTTLFFFVTIVASGESASADDERRSVVEEIARIWNEREAKTSNFKCAWVSECVLGAGTQSTTDENGEWIELPPDDLVVERTYELTISGKDRFRCDLHGPQLAAEAQSITPRTYVAVSDIRDGTWKGYIGKDEESSTTRFPPIGMVDELAISKSLDARDIELKALLLLYRPSFPLESETEVELAGFADKGEATIDGTNCVLLEKVDGNSRTQFFVDMQLGAVVRRASRWLRESPRGGEWKEITKVTVDYTQTDKGEAIPTGWKATYTKRDGRLLSQSTTRVTSIETNLSIPDSVFQFDFPVGTIVNVYKTGERYILGEGGSKRTITAAEAKARVPYTRLLATESGMGTSPPSLEPEQPKRLYLIIGLNLAALLVLLLVFVRRRTRRTTVGK